MEVFAWKKIITKITITIITTITKTIIEITKIITTTKITIDSLNSPSDLLGGFYFYIDSFSNIIVTGPSFKSSTFISAPNFPV